MSQGAYRVNDAEFGRLISPVRQNIDAAFVVLEAPKLAGLSLRQIADYAAMTGLAALRPDAAKGLTSSSILTLFRDTAAGRPLPPEATAFDLAYLEGLYGSGAGYSAEQKTRSMAIRINGKLSGKP